MPQELIAQFKRNFNSPIETNRLVDTIPQRDAIPTLVRWEGMLVYVVSEGLTFSLAGGIDNTSWEPFTGLEDAPEDGNEYVRKDGSWEIITSSGLPYQLYSAKLLNSSSAPLVNVLYNSTGKTFTWTRSGVGVMVAVPDTSYDVDKVTVSSQVQTSGTIENERIGISINTSNVVLVYFKNGTASDDGNSISVEIKIYP